MARWSLAVSSRRPRRLTSVDTWRAAFIAATIAWAVLLVAVPLLASRDHLSAPASLLIVAVYAIGSLVCHQLPERSYHLWTVQIPVCARCAGIYVGAMVGAVGARAFQAGGRRSERLVIRKARTVLVLAVTPSALTLVYEWATGVMPSHAIRAAAGAAIGVAVAWLVVAAADNQVN